MAITRMDHVNLRTNRLDAMIDWYDAVLGMKTGPRPDFPFAGAWIYAGDIAVVHLIEVDEAGSGSETALKLEHFAFAATDLDAFLSNLERREIRFERGELPDIGLVQINVWDPDGNHIHVDFSTR